MRVGARQSRVVRAKPSGHTGDGSCRFLGLRCMQQEGAPAGCVRRSPLPAPLQAVGEGEAQLTVTRASQSISPFAPPAFAGFRAPMKRSDSCLGIGRSSLPPSGLPLGIPGACATRYPWADPCRPPRVRYSGFAAAPVPLTAPTSVGFWASRSKARSPGRPGLLRASLAFGAAARLRLLPHTASQRQDHRLAAALLHAVAFKLAVATNSLHRGLAPPIQGPCLAHVE